MLGFSFEADHWGAFCRWATSREKTWGRLTEFLSFPFGPSSFEAQGGYQRPRRENLGAVEKILPFAGDATHRRVQTPAELPERERLGAANKSPFSLRGRLMKFRQEGHADRANLGAARKISSAGTPTVWGEQESED